MRLSTIRNLYGGAGPWASVYLDATGTQKTGTPQEARRQLDLRWRAARESLHRDGADEATLAAIDDVIGTLPATGAPAEVAVIASHGTVGFSRIVFGESGRDSATWSTQPRAADLVRTLDSGAAEVGWVTADLDRTGGTIIAFDGGSETVRGEDQFIRKVKRAGHGRAWSDNKTQRAAEENWGQNSAEVARAVERAVERSGADVVVLTGDVRARQLVLDQLPPTTASCVVDVDHEVNVRPHPEDRVRARRDADVFDPAIVAATHQAMDAVAADRRRGAVDRFHAGLSNGLSVRGLGPVCAAARDLSIDTLVLAVEPSHRQAWVDPLNPTMVGESKKDTGADTAISQCADDALVGACALGGAESLVIEADAELVDGLGAILRFADPTAPQATHYGSHERHTGGPIIGGGPGELI